MKKIIILLLFISVSSCAQNPNTNTYTEAIKEYQYNMNKAFADKKTTPFNEKDYKDFRSLDFFPIDSSYRVVAEFKGR